MLTGCLTTVPVVREFPEPPASALEPCKSLSTVNEASLSGLMKTVTVNYATYYECAIKQNAWIEWYKIQEQIQNGAIND